VFTGVVADEVAVKVVFSPGISEVDAKFTLTLPVEGDTDEVRFTLSLNRAVLVLSE